MWFTSWGRIDFEGQRHFVPRHLLCNMGFPGREEHKIPAILVANRPLSQLFVFGGVIFLFCCQLFLGNRVYIYFDLK